jgi:hypothetical protein
MHRSCLSGFLFAAFSAICASQTTGHYTVTGTVVNLATGEPVRHALVAVGSSLVFTGADGRFQAENVPEGQTMVSAQKPGYFDCSTIDCVGSSSRATTILTVHAGNNDVQLKLVPESKIQGRVVDDDGEPLSNIQVVAMAEHIVNGLKQLRDDGGASTDENGNYRIERLMPGNYTVRTTARLAFLFFYGDSSDLAPQLYPQRFYPNASEASAAQVLELKPGQEAEADFTLKAAPAFRISGSVMPAMPGLSIEAEDGNGAAVAAQWRFNPKTGRFWTFVPAGMWTLCFTGHDQQGHSAYAVEPLAVSSKNIDNLQIMLQPLASVPVNITGAINEGLQQIHVELASTDLRSRGRVFVAAAPPPSPAPGNAEAPYVISDVPPGKYHVHVYMPNDSECIDSLSSGNVDLTREDLVISPGPEQQPVHVALRSDCASLQVSVHLEDRGARPTLLLIPSSHAIPPSTMQLEPGGTTAFNLLSPGDYQVYAFSSIEGLEYANPDVMREFSGQQIRLSASQHASVTLQVIAR